jgi:hypothetical protein
MNKKQNQEKSPNEEKKKMVENYYKKAMRVIEYYVLICFILITFVPLLNYGWVPGFIKFIYMTGFPLLVLLFVISLVKEPLINSVTKLLGK